jgi:hypothetical protein
MPLGFRIRDGSKIRIRIRDEPPGSYFRELRNNFLGYILQFFDADPGSGMEKLGSGINIPDPQHCFTTNCGSATTPIPVSSAESLNTKSNKKYSQKMYNRANNGLNKYLVSEYILYLKNYLKGSKDSSAQEATSPCYNYPLRTHLKKSKTFINN